MNTKLLNQLIENLPLDIFNLIFEYTGYHKLRNGKYMVQIKKNNPIYDNLLKMPVISDGRVMLLVKTEWFRKSFCDKIITLFPVDLRNIQHPHHQWEYLLSIQSLNNENINENETIVEVYDYSWHEYDFDGSLHHIKNESLIYHCSNV